MKKVGRLFLLGVLAASAACVCGCATSRMDEVLLTAPDALGYLIRGAQGDAAGQQASARAIAVAAFAGLVKDLKPADDSLLAGPWEKYLQSLRQPIAIPESVYESNAVLSSKDLKTLRQYVAENPGVLTLRGPELCTPWAEELARVGKRVEALGTVFDKLVKEGKDAAAAQQFGTAFGAFSKAWDIRSGDGGALAELRAATAAWSAARRREADTQLKVRFVRAAALVPRFGAADPDLKAVGDCEQEVVACERAVEAMQSEVAQAQKFAGDPAVKANADAVNAVVRGIQPEFTPLRRAFWIEYARSVAKTRRYWEAYRRLDRQIASARDLSLAEGLRTAYLSMLPGGLEYLMGRANDNYEKDRYGAAVTFCFMAEELLDFAVQQKFPVDRNLLDWQKRIEDTREDTVKKIYARLARRLIILDFMIALTDEGENFGYHLRDFCRRTYEDPNPLTWALQVPNQRSITLKEAGNASDQDYVVPGHVKEITVHEVPGEELDRRIDAVGSRNVRMVPDPLYGVTQKESRTLFSQEVYLFQRVSWLHRKEARISYEIVYEHGGRKMPLCRADVRFPSEQGKLPDVVMECTEVRYDSPFLGTPRIAHDEAALTQDPWPKAVPRDLSADKDIERAVLRWALETIVRSVDHVVAQYPIADLAAGASQLDAAGKSVEATEKWGDCLLYCYMISAAQHKGAAPAGWLARRDRMLADIADFCRGRWQAHDAKAQESMRNLWANAVGHVLASEP